MIDVKAALARIEAKLDSKIDYNGWPSMSSVSSP